MRHISPILELRFCTKIYIISTNYWSQTVRRYYLINNLDSHWLKRVTLFSNFRHSIIYEFLTHGAELCWILVEIGLYRSLRLLRHIFSYALKRSTSVDRIQTQNQHFLTFPLELYVRIDENLPAQYSTDFKGSFKCSKKLEIWKRRHMHTISHHQFSDN